MKVARGSYEQMPPDWSGAIVNFYVGAITYEEALTKSVSVIHSKGMVFLDLVGGKVMQLDLDRWWDEYVMANYSEYSDYFPPQDQVACIVREGLVFHGPFAGWKDE